MNLIQVGAEICRNFDADLSHEWFETNGLGGFASSTIGDSTRDAIMVCSSRPPSHPSVA
jgi:hypothetical protein